MSAAGGAAGAGDGGGTPAAGGTPPAAPAAGGAPPPPPAAPPARAAGGKGKPNGKGGKTPPFDQHPGFRKRVDQEALRVLRRELGVGSLEEAKELLAGRAPAPGGDGGAPAAPPAGGQPNPNPNAPPAQPPRAGESPRERKLREDNQALRDRVARQHKQILKGRDGKRAEVTALELKFQAVQAGISERYVNFALAEYRELFMQYTAKPGSVAAEIKAAFDRDPTDDRAAFSYIRAQNPMIAAAAAQPPVVVPLDPSTAPPASRQPGEDVPPPKAPGAGGEKPFNAADLSDKDWREYKRRNGMNF